MYELFARHFITYEKDNKMSLTAVLTMLQRVAVVVKCGYQMPLNLKVEEKEKWRRPVTNLPCEFFAIFKVKRVYFTGLFLGFFALWASIFYKLLEISVTNFTYTIQRIAK